MGSTGLSTEEVRRNITQKLYKNSMVFIDRVEQISYINYILSKIHVLKNQFFLNIRRCQN